MFKSLKNYKFELVAGLLSVSLGVGTYFSFHGPSEKVQEVEVPENKDTSSEQEAPKNKDTSSEQEVTISLPLPEKREVKEIEPTKVKHKTLNIDPDRAVPLFGQVTGGMRFSTSTIESVAVADKIRSLDNGTDPIYLLISSPGGAVFGGGLILSAMEESKSPVYTICIQVCASMAFIIHQYGVERYAVNRAILMSHQAAGGTQGYVAEMRSMISFVERVIDKIDTKIAKRAGHSLYEYQLKIAPELWIDAEDATAMNFNDAVVKVRTTGGMSLIEDMLSRYNENVTLPVNPFRNEGPQLILKSEIYQNLIHSGAAQ